MVFTANIVSIGNMGGEYGKNIHPPNGQPTVAAS